MFGVSPQLGRAFTEQEDVPGHDRVAVLMNDLWRTQFGSDAGILGKTIRLNGYEYTVIGVMPAGFHLPYAQDSFHAGAAVAKPTEVLEPMAFSKDQLAEDMGDFNYYGVARLKAGVTAAQASDEINSLDHRIQAGLAADEQATLSALITPLKTELVGDNEKPLLILLAAVAGLLLVGCVNMTNLLLSRAVGQRQQMAVAAALGARPRRPDAMAIRETAVLAAVGAALGLLLATAVLPVMQRYMPAALDFRGTLHVDWVGAGCAVLLALAATLIAGAAPGWMARRMNPVEALRGRGAHGQRRTEQQKAAAGAGGRGSGGERNAGADDGSADGKPDAADEYRPRIRRGERGDGEDRLAEQGLWRPDGAYGVLPAGAGCRARGCRECNRLGW